MIIMTKIKVIMTILCTGVDKKTRHTLHVHELKEHETRTMGEATALWGCHERLTLTRKRDCNKMMMIACATRCCNKKQANCLIWRVDCVIKYMILLRVQFYVLKWSESQQRRKYKDCSPREVIKKRRKIRETRREKSIVGVQSFPFSRAWFLSVENSVRRKFLRNGTTT